MVDTVTTSTMGNDNDDWEVAVDTGEFDKRLEQQEKDRAAKQESMSSIVNYDDNLNSLNIDLMKSNKPIRILKRPPSQNQLFVPSDNINFNTTTTTLTINNTVNNNSSFSNHISSSTTVPVISIIPRNSTKNSTNSIQIINSPNSSSSQSTKPTIKTYEQRELEYRLARLRIMGEEESSTKDDDDDINDNNNNPTIESTSITSDDPIKTTSSSTTTLTSPKLSNKTTNSSQQSFQSRSTPNSYASNLYALNNTGAIYFTPSANSTGPFSQQTYRGGAYSNLCPQMPSIPPTRYPSTTFYMPSPVSSSSNYPIQSSMNNWFHYQQHQQQQQQQNPYGTQQYTRPQ